MSRDIFYFYSCAPQTTPHYEWLPTIVLPNGHSALTHPLALTTAAALVAGCDPSLGPT